MPTLKEVGHDFETGGWLGFFVPAATSRAVVEKISADTSKVIAVPAFRDKFILAVGLEPMNVPMAQFATVVKESKASYVSLFSKVSIKME